jgi:steroid Delta-isomerase
MNTNTSSTVWRKMIARMPVSLLRTHIEQVAHRYVESWASGDIAGRLALFADNAVVEDPASVLRASNGEELRAFFSSGIPPTWDLSFSFVRIVVVGNEAILTYETTLRIEDATPSKLLINTHMVFNEAGLIASFRTFFDEEAITDYR